MLKYLDNPIVATIVSAVAALFAFAVVYLEMPPRLARKTGTTTPLRERLTQLSRTGKVLFLVGILMTISAIASLLEVAT